MQAQTTVTEVYSGITRHSVNRTLNGRSGVKYEVMVLNLLDPNLSFIMTPPVTSGTGETATQTTRNFASANATDLAVNVHYFEALSGGRADLKSFAASAGVAFSPFERSQPGHTFALNLSADNFAEMVGGNDSQLTFTTTSSLPFNTLGFFPILYRGGAVASLGASDYRARTIVGVSREGATLFLLASNTGMTEGECADILVQEFGAWNVFGLDGGGSTTMVLRTGATTQTIIARESIFGERAVGSNLGVFSAPAVTGIPSTMSWDADPSTAGIQQGGGVWDFQTNHWQASGTNRTWANPKTPVLGNGGGALVTLGGRIGVRDLSVAGGYTIGTVSGPKFIALGELTTTGTSPTVINAPLGESTGFRKRGGQTLQLGTSARISFLELSEGTVDLGGNTLTFLDPFVPLKFTGGTLQNGRVVLTVGPSFLDVPTGSTTLQTDLTAQAGLGKSGSGTLVLGGAVSISGALDVRAGGLDLGSSNPSITTLRMGGVAGEATALDTGNGTLTLGGTLTYDASKGPGGASIAGGVALGANRIFDVGDSAAAADDLTVTASLTGATFNLTKNGAGRLVLAGSNSFNTLNLFVGSLRCDAAGALPAGKPVVVRDAFLDLNGFDQSISSLTLGNTTGFSDVQTGTGTLTMTSLIYNSTSNGTGGRIRGKVNLGSTTQTFTINDSSNAAPDTVIEASITSGGSAGLIKTGGGRLDLAGALSIPGTFTVNNGELRLTGSDVSLGSVTLGGIAGARPVLDTRTAKLTLGGTLTYSATNHGLGGVLRGKLETGSAVRTFAINDSTNAAVDLRIEAAISGSGGITKTGAGTLELAGANEMTGALLCSSGRLRLSHSSALGQSASVTISTGAVLDALSLAQSTLPVNRSSLTVAGSGTLDGSVALSEGRLAAHAGGLDISGAFSATGGTTEVTVGTGAAQIAVAGAVALGGRLVVNAGGTLAAPQSIPIITGASVSGSFQELVLPQPPQATLYSISITATQVLFVASQATPTQVWLNAQGLPLDIELTEDLEGDGRPLLLEYALGGSANNPDPALVEVGRDPENRLQISFLWNNAATDLAGAVWGSDDLASWSTILEKSGTGPWSGSASFLQEPTGGFTRITVTDPGAGVRRFLKVRVTRP